MNHRRIPSEIELEKARVVPDIAGRDISPCQSHLLLSEQVIVEQVLENCNESVETNNNE
jgi:hypothetical protein